MYITQEEFLKQRIELRNEVAKNKVIEDFSLLELLQELSELNDINEDK